MPQLKLAILAAGALSCLVHLFSGLLVSGSPAFYAAPIALLGMLPLVFRQRTAQTTFAMWLLAATFLVAFLREHLEPAGAFHFIDGIECLMLVVMLHAFHARPIAGPA
jgi:hypothetical protein